MALRTENRIDLESFVSSYDSERPVDWEKCFGRRAPLDLEIGFGLGDFLVRKASGEPDRNFVGLELDWLRVKKTMAKLWVARQTSSTSPFRNIRLLQIDAVVALERFFRQRTISRVYCLFPCPWPKKSHVKHRLFSQGFARLVNSRLADGGEVQIVTDFRPYFHWLQNEIAGTGFEIFPGVVKPQFDTKYERKWCGAGQKEFYELRLVKKAHQDVALKEDVPLQVYFIDQVDPDKFHLDEEKGEITVVQKDFIFDARRGKGMVHVLVAEPTITQHLWVVIAKTSRGWCVAKAEGHTALPTVGVARAIKKIAEAAAESGGGKPRQSS